jgi:hypothetical protein
MSPRRDPPAGVGAGRSPAAPTVTGVAVGVVLGIDGARVPVAAAFRTAVDGIAPLDAPAPTAPTPTTVAPFGIAATARVRSDEKSVAC